MYAFAMPLDEKEYPKINHWLESRKLQQTLTQMHQSIRFKIACATIDQFENLIREEPSIFHFAGHGDKNDAASVKRFPELKGQGDFLILEQDNLAQPFSEKQLMQVLKEIKNIQLVILASCHSEKMAGIFVKSGVKHVVCIRKDCRIQDEAMIYFSDLFYRYLFQHGLSICQAFSLTKKQMKAKYEMKDKDFEFCK